MLEPILQQVGAGNPQLAQLIGQNREQFLQLLSEDVDDDAPLPPGAQAISVTEQEREAIERVSILLRLLPETKLLKYNHCSYADSASSEIWSSKHTLPATRMRNWRRIFCSINQMIRRIPDVESAGCCKGRDRVN